MLDKPNEIIKRGFKKIPGPAIKPNRALSLRKFTYKYPVDTLREPKENLFDSMAVCEYSHYNMGRVNSYLRAVILKKFPERKFSLRKQKVKNKERVVVYRIV